MQAAEVYLQLAVVQAGHWNLLHFHLPEVPDERTLLWSCCSCSQHWPGQGCRAGRERERQRRDTTILVKQWMPISLSEQQHYVDVMQVLTSARWTRSLGVTSHSYSLRTTQNRETNVTTQKHLITDRKTDVSLTLPSCRERLPFNGSSLAQTLKKTKSGASKKYNKNNARRERVCARTKSGANIQPGA